MTVSDRLKVEIDEYAAREAAGAPPLPEAARVLIREWAAEHRRRRLAEADR